jgi:abortive infection bacteriophage resistance protein
LEEAFFLKDFKTIDEQIQILLDRGLIINDIERAKLYLLSQNYYNIINGYANFFPHIGEKYSNGTNFDEITRLYTFEKEIKQAIFKSIIDVETHLKSIFIYHFAKTYKDIPYAYLNIDCYDKSKTLSVISTISTISRIIDKYKKDNNPNSIKHYIKNYQNVPIWVLSNYLDFGTLRYMLMLSTTNIQNAVAKDMMSFIKQHIPNATIFTPEVMLSFIENINDIRNICAHNNRLIGFNCRRDCKYWSPLHDKYNISSKDTRRNVFSVLISLQCFLSIPEYGTVQNKIRKQTNRLDNSLKTISINTILDELGFPKAWHKNVKKIQYNVNKKPSLF